MAKIVFSKTGRSVEADPQDAPFTGRGRSGSLLDIAGAFGVELPQDCGGVCLCVTCHVKVVSGGEHLSPPTAKETQMLEKVAAACGCTGARLACQAVVREGAVEIVVENPHA